MFRHEVYEPLPVYSVVKRTNLFQLGENMKILHSIIIATVTIGTVAVVAVITFVLSKGEFRALQCKQQMQMYCATGCEWINGHIQLRSTTIYAFCLTRA